MEIKAEDLRLDYRKLEFPTDQVRLKQVRDLQQDLSDRARLRTIPALELDVFRAFDIEMVLADAAFRAALGLHDPEAARERRVLYDELDRVYTAYAISTGSHQTEQLVRSLEAAAVKQAEFFLPRSR